jgi:putative phosphoribosyl transferase
MFRDRIDAAKKIIPYLEKYRNEECVVLAIPNGSVPMAFLIARQLDFPLDLMMSKKIGYPGNPEFAIGSVSLIGRILDPRKDIDPEYINEVTNHIRELLHSQYQRFMGSKTPIKLEGKTVILVDDGIATGFTMLEAIETVREHLPKKIVVAIPVGPPEAIEYLKSKADEVICLDSAPGLHSVGQFYEEFSHVSDQEVTYWMHKSRQFGNTKTEK